MANSHYINDLKILLKEVRYPHIDIISDVNLDEIFFKCGNARLEVLRWIFCQIDEETCFSDDKLKEELLDFSTCYGLCSLRNSKSLILGVPESSGKAQFEFWRLVIETVRDVRNYKQMLQRGEQPRPGEFLQHIVKSGALEDVLSSSRQLNVCPQLIKNVRTPSPPNSLVQQRDALGDQVRQRQTQLDSLSNHTQSLDNSACALKLGDMLQSLEIGKDTLKCVLQSVPNPKPLSESQTALKNSLDFVSDTSKHVIKYVEEQKYLESVSHDITSVAPVSDDPPSYFSVVQNNFKP